MKFKKLFNIFDEDYELTDVLAGIADQGSESRKFLNDHIRSLKDSGEVQKSLEVEEKINELTVDHSEVNFIAGYCIGQVFDATDPEAVKEIKLVQKKLADVLGCWPRKKTPDQAAKQDSGASRQ